MKKDSYLAASSESKVESIFNLAASGSYDDAYEKMCFSLDLTRGSTVLTLFDPLFQSLEPVF